MEYYKTALAQNFDAMSASNSIDQDTPTNAQTIDDVRKAIEKLKNGRAPGANSLPPELLKCAIDPISERLHSLFLVSLEICICSI